MGNLSEELLDKESRFRELESKFRENVREIAWNFALHIKQLDGFKFSGIRGDQANEFISSMLEDYDDLLEDRHLEKIDFRIKPAIVCFRAYMRQHISGVYVDGSYQIYSLKLFCNWMVEEIITFLQYYFEDQAFSETPLKQLEMVSTLFDRINFKMFPLSYMLKDIKEKEL